HMGEPLLEPVADLVQAGSTGLLADADLNEGFRTRLARRGDLAGGVSDDAQDGMDDEMDGEVVAVELHRHRIDEEGHVVVDDLDQGMRGMPAILVGPRGEDAGLGPGALAPAALLP